MSKTYIDSTQAQRKSWGRCPRCGEESGPRFVLCLACRRQAQTYRRNQKAAEDFEGALNKALDDANRR